MPSAEYVAWAKFRVTFVSLVALLILGVLTYLLTGGRLFHPEVTLYLFVPDATGLSKGSPVRVNGIGVGKVDVVGLSGSMQPNRMVRVKLRIERERLAAIPDDSFAELSSDTLIGDKYVDITSGRGAKSIAPDREITYKPQEDLTKSLDINQFQEQLRQMDAILADIEQGKGRVGEFVQGEQLYNGFRKRLSEIQSTVTAAANATSPVGQALYSDELYRQIHDPLAELDAGLARLESGQGAGGQLLRDSSQYKALQAGAQELRRSISDLRSSDMVQSDRLYNQWLHQIASVIQSVDQAAAGPLLSTPLAYDNLNGTAKELRDTLKDFREHPGKYLRLKVF